MTEFDEPTILLGHVCAARFDTRVPAAEFVRMVARLVDIAVKRAHTSALLSDLGVLDSSTGAAEAEPKADIHTGETDAASVTPPAAPSIEPAKAQHVALVNRGSSEPQHGAAAGVSPPVIAGSTPAEVQHTPLADLDSTRDATIAAPASSQSAAPLSESTADDDAGTSPAGPDAGAEASQPRLRRTAEQAAALRESIIRDYLAALAANDGLLPSGWVVNKAREVGVSNVSIYRAISAAPRKQAPAPVANGHAAPSRPGVREHTRKADCWCRRLPANQWCTATTLPAALSTPRPRADRYKPVRY